MFWRKYLTECSEWEEDGLLLQRKELLKCYSKECKIQVSSCNRMFGAWVDMEKLFFIRLT